MDNEPEFILKLTKAWSESLNIEFKYIQPGKASQNAYVQRFNRTYRAYALFAYLFGNLNEVREQTERCIEDYYNERPLDSLGGQSPRMFKNKQQQTHVLSFASARPLLHSAHVKTKENVSS
jgi:putative transposase